MRAVRAAAGPDVAVTAKVNMADGVRGGFWLDESVEFARMLEADGSLDALTLTGGSSFENPMYLFRGEAPVAEMAEMFPGVLKTGIKLFGGQVLQGVPVRGGVLPAVRAPVPRRARRCRSSCSAGINRLDTITQALDDGFAFVQIGRALLREPDSRRRCRRTRTAKSLCIHCNKCMPTIYTGTRCVLVSDSGRSEDSSAPDLASALIPRYSSRFWCRFTMRHSSVGDTVRCVRPGWCSPR